MRTCTHGEQTIIIFGLPCWFSSSRLSGLLPCVVQLKMEHGTSACMTQPASFCAAVSVIWAWASSRVISSLIVTFCLPSTCADMLFLSCKLRNCGRLQNALERRVPTIAERSLRFLPARQFVSSVLPCATNLAEHDCPQNKPRGVSLCNGRPPTCTSSALSLCKWSAAPISPCHTHPPSKNKHLIMAFYAGEWCPGCIRKKALFLIGIKIETAEREHELMKGTGRIFCPCVFCLVPAEKRDTLCSANELSAAITVYTASSEPCPCGFWHGAPQCLTRSMDVWPGHQGNTTVTQEHQRAGT